MSIKKVFLLFSGFILMVIFCNCSKDGNINPNPDPAPMDWRKPFEGLYDFTIIHSMWSMVGGITRDTSKTDGTVQLWKKDRMLIKYNNGVVYGIFRHDTIDCTGYSLVYIPDSMLDNPQSGGWYDKFWGYYLSWVSPVMHDDTTLSIPCIFFNPEPGGIHETFGGYFTGNDSVYFGYSSGGLGAGTYTDIYGVKIQK